MTPRRLTVLMPFHSPFSAPLAVGASRGHFRDEGLDVSITSAAAYGKSTASAVADGDVDVSSGRALGSIGVMWNCGEERLFHLFRRCMSVAQWRRGRGRQG